MSIDDRNSDDQRPGRLSGLDKSSAVEFPAPLDGAAHESSCREAYCPPMPTTVVTATLIAVDDGGATAYVHQAGACPEAVAARSIIDLHGGHIGRDVLVVFDRGDPARPVVIGVLKGQAGWPMSERPDGVNVQADGQRLVVQAREQLVLQCGKASITLNRSGKVSIEGTQVTSRATGANRIRGGSVQLN